MADTLINFYQGNPTAGAQDGTAITSDAPIDFTLDASLNESKTIKLAVRTALGYISDGTVTIADVNDTNDRLKLCWTENGTFADSISTNDIIRDTNKIFYAKATSTGSDYPAIERAKFVVRVGLKAV